MTYRKLFLWLLAGSTLAVVVLWWMSFRGTYDILLESHGDHYGMEIRQGMSRFFYTCDFSSDSRSAADATGFLDHFQLPGSVDRWERSFQAFTPGSRAMGVYEIVGSFHLGRKLENYSLGHDYTANYYLAFPLWAAWLPCVTIGYCVMRLVEKRTAAKQVALPDKTARTTEQSP